MVNRRFPLFVWVIVLLGLALRIASAQGGLWLDEAWSAELARQAHTPLGVFLNINHDNNHHLNSLWLQYVGLGAPPPLARAFSIATGTAGIAVAGWIGHRRSPALPHWMSIGLAGHVDLFVGNGEGRPRCLATGWPV